MGDYNLEIVDDGGHERLMAKKGQLENMLKDYVQDAHYENNPNVGPKSKKLRRIRKKNKKRDNRIETIKMKTFQSDLKNRQLSKMMKRDAQQVKLCKKIFKLASDLEKKKLIDEKKLARQERDK